MDSITYSKINNLLTILRGNNRPNYLAVDFYNNYFLKGFNNSAPGNLLKDYIDELQEELDKHK